MFLFIEIPFLVLLLKLAINFAGKEGELSKNATILAVFYSIGKISMQIIFSDFSNASYIIAGGIIIFFISWLYFYLVIKLYETGFIWWLIIITGFFVLL